MSIYNENEEILMDGTAVHYEEETSTVVPEGRYLFRILKMKREQVNATEKMPRHVNIRFMMLLETADGEAGRVWDNLRMYKKWLWKYSQVAKSIGHTPRESSDIVIDWNRFEGSTGLLEATVGDFKKRDGTVVQQNSFKFLPKEGVADEDIPPLKKTVNSAEEMDF